MGWQLYCAFSMMIDLIIYLKLVLLKNCIKNCKKYIVIINIANSYYEITVHILEILVNKIII